MDLTDFTLAKTPKRMPITTVTTPPPAPSVVPWRPPPNSNPRYPGPGEGIPGTNIDLTKQTNAGSYGGPEWQQGLAAVGGPAASGNLSAATPFDQSPGILGGYAGVNGNAVRNDPAVEAANQEFNRLVAPELINQYTLSGLGRSSALPTALSLGQASMLTPLMQDALAREQHRLDRGYGATEEELARRERSSVRRYEATLQQAQGLQGLGQGVWNQRQGAIDTGIQAGGVERGVAQNQLTSAYNDFLRRQGLAETSTMGPFGQLLPGAFGSRTVGK